MKLLAFFFLVPILIYSSPISVHATLSVDTVSNIKQQCNNQQEFRIHTLQSELLNYQVFSMQGKLADEGTCQYQDNNLNELNGSFFSVIDLLKIDGRQEIKFIVS